MATMENLYRNPASSLTYHHDSYSYITPSKYAGSLKSKVVLITGAGRGIGRASALAFAAAGASVACMARTRSDVEGVVKEIKGKGHSRSIAVVGDVTDPEVPARALKEIETALGHVDILINNAGISRVSDIEHEKDILKTWNVIDVNMKGTLAFIYAVLPSMVLRKSGCIINVVSVLATISLPYFSAYSAAKAGLIRATHIMDMEFRPHGIYSYAVHPCMCADTTLGQGAFNMEAYEKVERVKQFAMDFGPSMQDTLALPADTFVALAADPDAKHMSGKYIDSCQDLGEVLQEAKKGPDGRIEKEGLYTLKVDTL
jgi:NAD(P)-dependent dehydrogenase (short-subunit alcohol dehydrogenase family)